MKKIFLLIILLWGTIMYAHSQLEWRRMTVSGGLGLQFGDYTLINVAPQIGYDFNRYMNLGAGVTYSHFKQKANRNTYNLSNDYLGANIYARIYPIPFIVLMIQPEVNRMWREVKFTNGNKITENKVVPTCLIGAGLRFGSVSAMIQYDLAQNSNSPYGDKLFYSIGYTFYLGW